MKPNEKYKMKKRISAGIAILLAVSLVKLYSSIEKDCKIQNQYIHQPNRVKKRISAGIAFLLAVSLVVSLIAPFIGYGIY